MERQKWTRKQQPNFNRKSAVETKYVLSGFLISTFHGRYFSISWLDALNILLLNFFSGVQAHSYFFHMSRNIRSYQKESLAVKKRSGSGW